MTDLLDRLKGGDRRSIGQANQVAQEVLREPVLFATLFGGMTDSDPLVRMRAADAAEKVTAIHPDYLEPYKHQLMTEVARIEQQEVQWHVAQMLPRLELNSAERRAAVTLLENYLEKRSIIVKTSAMQALAELAERDPDLRPGIIPHLERLTRCGSAAMKSRGRKLLERLGEDVTWGTICGEQSHSKSGEARRW